MAIGTKTAIVQVRVNPRIKKSAQKTFEKMGLDISSAVNLFLHQVVTTQSIPFEVRTVNGFTPAQEREYIKQSAWAEKHAKRYDSVDELMDSIK
jgi:DNA-damage-inducible protein J